MDCLDIPDLELEILQALAGNVASTTADGTDGQNDEALDLILKGGHLASSRTSNEPSNEKQNEFEANGEDFLLPSSVNHAISYASYVRALPLDILHGKSEQHVKALCEILNNLGEISVNLGADPKGEEGSAGLPVDHPKMCMLLDNVLHAISHVETADKSLSPMIASAIERFIKVLARCLQAGPVAILATGIRLFTAFHHHLISHGIPAPIRSVPVVHTFFDQEVVSNVDRHPTPISSPASTSDKDGAIHARTHRSGEAARQDDNFSVIYNFSSQKLITMVIDLEGALITQEMTGLPCSPAWKSLTTESMNPISRVEIESDIRREALELWHRHDNLSDVGDDGVRAALLKLMTLTSLQSETDAQAARLRQILNDADAAAPVMDMALACVCIMVLNHHPLAQNFAQVVRRFVTSPLPVFEAEMAETGLEVPELMARAANTLALCLRLSGDSDLTTSTIYSLVNIGVSREGSIYAGMQAEERRMLGISTIGVVSRLTLSLGDKETTLSTISMLLQRLRSSDVATEGAIITFIVPLALTADVTTRREVFFALTQVARSFVPDSSRALYSAIVAALTQLSKGLDDLNCLQELLSLIVDRGLTNAELSSSLLRPLDVIAQSTRPPSSSIPLFRNVWLTLTMMGITPDPSIARHVPSLISEDERDFVTNLEYNSVFRRNQGGQNLRHRLNEILPKLSSEIRGYSVPQAAFLVAVYELESRRGKPSGMLPYFANESLNDSDMSKAMEGISEKLLFAYKARLLDQVLKHSMPQFVSLEVVDLFVGATHRFAQVRSTAIKFLDSILNTFSALLCDRKIVFALLEILTLLRRSCESEFEDEYTPVYTYTSQKANVTIVLSDNYEMRNQIALDMYVHAQRWLGMALSRAPIEVQSIMQHYLRESRDVLLLDKVELGAGLAMQYAKAISKLDRQEDNMPKIAGWTSDNSNLVASQFAAKNFYSGELSGARLMLNHGLTELHRAAPGTTTVGEMSAFRRQMAAAMRDFRVKNLVMPAPALRRLLLRAVSVLTASPKIDREILHYLVALPIRSFTPLSIAAGVDAWTWLIGERPDIEVALLSEVSDGWLWTIYAHKGLFNDSESLDPLDRPIPYAPTDDIAIEHNMKSAQRSLQPHLLLAQAISSRFQAVKYRESGIMLAIARLLLRSFHARDHISSHPLAREVRFTLTLFGFQVLQSSRLESSLELNFREELYAFAFSWFAHKPSWSYGSSRIQTGAEMALLEEVLSVLRTDVVRGDHDLTSMNERRTSFPLQAFASLREYTVYHKDRLSLLQLLIENEIQRLQVWSNVAEDTAPGRYTPKASNSSMSQNNGVALVRCAWGVSPGVAVQMAERFKTPDVVNEVRRLVQQNPEKATGIPEALQYLLGGELEASAASALKYLAVWYAVPAVTAVTYFQPRYRNHPLVLQYAMRVLEQHPVDLTFFFVPQVVQALRADGLGYVERFIFETSKISQLFCHQIIWNMKANCYKDDLAQVEDPMKPVLDRVVELIVSALSGKAKAFYDMEFDFFNQVTSISGTLKDFIKRPKPEKKAKIDEEMAKIDVAPGVYLPSNPDGVVVDIDKKSGRPLQSHAKAPFMATFKVRKEKVEITETTDAENADGTKLIESAEKKVTYDVWQAAIFKVGDDCRQDMLALQMMAMFKNIFEAAGVNLYLFPYRVTATAPGCGVIDVVPNATSRDEMGRAKINDLNSYFIDKYGSVDTIAFQKARMNFISSMAAYSVACYILQIKDRHNGNIMIDADGHIVHVDFGFLFDIGPGGVKFEPNSFKLNHEMVVLMGGRGSQGYRLFTELTIKAFLAIRPYADQLVDTVHLMLGTGLPSFKGEPTIKRLRDRFQLQLSEREAARYMMGVIRNAHENYRSMVYDGFQKAQNGIPY